MACRLLAVALLLAVLALAPAAAHAQSETLAKVRAAGFLTCGVSEGVPGFSVPGPDAVVRGMDADFCRALAAAVLGSPAVHFATLLNTARFPALRQGEIDVLARNTDWTLAREAALGVLFAGVLFYDQQGVLVLAKDAAAGLAGLQRRTVCVVRGTRHGDALLAYGAARGLSLKTTDVTSIQDVPAALRTGVCAAVTHQVSALIALAADGTVLLQDRIGSEPLAPVVRQGDDGWFLIVRDVTYALLLGEAVGITGQQAASFHAGKADAAVAAFLAASRAVGHDLGLDDSWAVAAIAAGGNYGEIFQRNFGAAGSIKLERGPNRLWTEGGLLYAPPFR